MKLLFLVALNLHEISLPLDVPGPAMFGREDFCHQVKKLAPGAYDEVYTCNPQSGSQWDGYRHVIALYLHPVLLLVTYL